MIPLTQVGIPKIPRYLNRRDFFITEDLGSKKLKLLPRRATLEEVGKGYRNRHKFLLLPTYLL